MNRAAAPLLGDVFDVVSRRLVPADEEASRDYAALVERINRPPQAMAIGIACETARSHLKAAFTKSGVARQADLAGLVTRITAAAPTRSGP